MELYLHIPFCIKKCAYCDFLSGPADRERQENYLRALKTEIRLAGFWHDRQIRQENACRGIRCQENICQEIRCRENACRETIPGDGDRITSVFIGGGTPSAVEAGQIAALMEQVRDSFRLAEDAEITMEANPGTLTREKLRIYRDAGINRLSMGLQSADDGELALLGRIHTWQDFLENYQAAREAGFANVNVDLMSALPGQTAASWERTLRKVISCGPEHISAYSLILEEGTPFYERYAGHPEALPDEDSDREMYHLTKQILAEAGYERYEISNYSRPGYACRHNIGYWRRVPYLGLGLGASSLYGERRFHNTADMGKYIRCLSDTEEQEDYEQEAYEQETDGQETVDSLLSAGAYRQPEALRSAALCRIREEEEILTARDRMAEFMFLGLRLTEGVRGEEFARQFGRTPEDVYGQQLERLTKEGLMERTSGGYRLTDWGVDVSNQVFVEFI